jgi:hypothetical protein
MRIATSIEVPSSQDSPAEQSIPMHLQQAIQSQIFFSIRTHEQETFNEIVKLATTIRPASSLNV